MCYLTILSAQSQKSIFSHLFFTWQNLPLVMAENKKKIIVDSSEEEQMKPEEEEKTRKKDTQVKLTADDFPKVKKQKKSKKHLAAKSLEENIATEGDPGREMGRNLEKKTKKKNNVDPEKYAGDLIDSLKEFYEKDLNRQPGVFKLQKLDNIDQVCTKLLNLDYQEKCLQRGVLSELRIWLEPLPDKSLPNSIIKKRLLDVLIHMKYISKSDLLNSEIGKIVHFYAKNSRETMEVRRMAKNLMTKWKGMIIAEEREEDE